VWAFFKLLSVLIHDKNKNLFTTKLSDKINKPETNIFFQLALWCLIYLETPMMIVLVLMGLTIKMDLYHVGLLFFFVFYMIAPRKFNKNIKILLLYASFFIVEKYIYTLVEVILQNNICCMVDGKPTGVLNHVYIWMEALGFDTRY